MGKRMRLALAPALLCLLSWQPATAAITVTGTVQYPCVSPVFTHRGVPQIGGQGVCGYKFMIPVENRYYRIHPHTPAELEVTFYDASGEVTDNNGGPSLTQNQCVDLEGRHRPTAKYAIVVVSPNACSRNTNIAFSYTAS